MKNEDIKTKNPAEEIITSTSPKKALSLEDLLKKVFPKNLWNNKKKIDEEVADIDFAKGEIGRDLYKAEKGTKFKIKLRDPSKPPTLDNIDIDTSEKNKIFDIDIATSDGNTKKVNIFSHTLEIIKESRLYIKIKNFFDALISKIRDLKNEFLSFLKDYKKSTVDNTELFDQRPILESEVIKDNNLKKKLEWPLTDSESRLEIFSKISKKLKKKNHTLGNYLDEERLNLDVTNFNRPLYLTDEEVAKKIIELTEFDDAQVWAMIQDANARFFFERHCKTIFDYKASDNKLEFLQKLWLDSKKEIETNSTSLPTKHYLYEINNPTIPEELDKLVSSYKNSILNPSARANIFFNSKQKKLKLDSTTTSSLSEDIKKINNGSFIDQLNSYVERLLKTPAKIISERINKNSIQHTIEDHPNSSTVLNSFHKEDLTTIFPNSTTKEPFGIFSTYNIDKPIVSTKNTYSTLPWHYGDIEWFKEKIKRINQERYIINESDISNFSKDWIEFKKLHNYNILKPLEIKSTENTVGWREWLADKLEKKGIPDHFVRNKEYSNITSAEEEIVTNELGCQYFSDRSEKYSKFGQIIDLPEEIKRAIAFKKAIREQAVISINEHEKALQKLALSKKLNVDDDLEEVLQNIALAEQIERLEQIENGINTSILEYLDSQGAIIRMSFEFPFERMPLYPKIVQTHNATSYTLTSEHEFTGVLKNQKNQEAAAKKNDPEFTARIISEKTKDSNNTGPQQPQPQSTTSFFDLSEWNLEDLKNLRHLRLLKQLLRQLNNFRSSGNGRSFFDWFFNFNDIFTTTNLLYLIVALFFFIFIKNFPFKKIFLDYPRIFFNYIYEFINLWKYPKILKNAFAAWRWIYYFQFLQDNTNVNYPMELPSKTASSDPYYNFDRNDYNPTTKRRKGRYRRYLNSFLRFSGSFIPDEDDIGEKNFERLSNFFFESLFYSLRLRFIIAIRFIYFTLIYFIFKVYYFIQDLIRTTFLNFPVFRFFFYFYFRRYILFKFKSNDLIIQKIVNFFMTLKEFIFFMSFSMNIRYYLGFFSLYYAFDLKENEIASEELKSEWFYPYRRFFIKNLFSLSLNNLMKPIKYPSAIFYWFSLNFLILLEIILKKLIKSELLVNKQFFFKIAYSLKVQIFIDLIKPIYEWRDLKKTTFFYLFCFFIKYFFKKFHYYLCYISKKILYIADKILFNLLIALLYLFLILSKIIWKTRYYHLFIVILAALYIIDIWSGLKNLYYFFIIVLDYYKLLGPFYSFIDFIKTLLHVNKFNMQQLENIETFAANIITNYSVYKKWHYLNQKNNAILFTNWLQHESILDDFKNFSIYKKFNLSFNKQTKYLINLKESKGSKINYAVFLKHYPEYKKFFNTTYNPLKPIRITEAYMRFFRESGPLLRQIYMETFFAKQEYELKFHAVHDSWHFYNKFYYMVFKTRLIKPRRSFLGFTFFSILTEQEIAKDAYSRYYVPQIVELINDAFHIHLRTDLKYVIKILNSLYDNFYFDTTNTNYSHYLSKGYQMHYLIAKKWGQKYLNENWINHRKESFYRMSPQKPKDYWLRTIPKWLKLVKKSVEAIWKKMNLIEILLWKYFVNTNFWKTYHNDPLVFSILHSSNTIENIIFFASSITQITLKWYSSTLLSKYNIFGLIKDTLIYFHYLFLKFWFYDFVNFKSNQISIEEFDYFWNLLFTYRTKMLLNTPLEYEIRQSYITTLEKLNTETKENINNLSFLYNNYKIEQTLDNISKPVFSLVALLNTIYENKNLNSIKKAHLNYLLTSSKEYYKEISKNKWNKIYSKYILPYKWLWKYLVTADESDLRRLKIKVTPPSKVLKEQLLFKNKILKKTSSEHRNLQTIQNTLYKDIPNGIEYKRLTNVKKKFFAKLKNYNFLKNAALTTFSTMSNISGSNYANAYQKFLISENEIKNASYHYYSPNLQPFSSVEYFLNLDKMFSEEIGKQQQQQYCYYPLVVLEEYSYSFTNYLDIVINYIYGLLAQKINNNTNNIYFLFFFGKDSYYSFLPQLLNNLLYFSSELCLIFWVKISTFLDTVNLNYEISRLKINDHQVNNLGKIKNFFRNKVFMKKKKVRIERLIENNFLLFMNNLFILNYFSTYDSNSLGKTNLITTTTYFSSYAFSYFYLLFFGWVYSFTFIFFYLSKTTKWLEKYPEEEEEYNADYLWQKFRETQPTLENKWFFENLSVVDDITAKKFSAWFWPEHYEFDMTVPEILEDEDEDEREDKIKEITKSYDLDFDVWKSSNESKYRTIVNNLSSINLFKVLHNAYIDLREEFIDDIDDIANVKLLKKKLTFLQEDYLNFKEKNFYNFFEKFKYKYDNYYSNFINFNEVLYGLFLRGRTFSNVLDQLYCNEFETTPIEPVLLKDLNNFSVVNQAIYDFFYNLEETHFKNLPNWVYHKDLMFVTAMIELMEPERSDLEDVYFKGRKEYIFIENYCDITFNSFFLYLLIILPVLFHWYFIYIVTSKIFHDINTPKRWKGGKLKYYSSFMIQQYFYYFLNYLLHINSLNDTYAELLRFRWFGNSSKRNRRHSSSSSLHFGRTRFETKFLDTGRQLEMYAYNKYFRWQVSAKSSFQYFSYHFCKFYFYSSSSIGYYVHKFLLFIIIYMIYLHSKSKHIYSQSKINEAISYDVLNIKIYTKIYSMENIKNYMQKMLNKIKL